jgi:hypothetical protein
MKLTLEELYKKEGFIKDIENLDEILNSEPKKEWLREHPQVRGFMYLPIEKVEFLLTRLFKDVKVEIRSVISSDNRAVVTVRIHFTKGGKETFLDGVGAAQINKIQSAEMAFPLAKSLAFKDSVKFLGKIFGKDLNRVEVSTVTKQSQFTEEQQVELEKVKLAAMKVSLIDNLETAWNELAIPKESPIYKAAKAIFAKHEVNLE